MKIIDITEADYGCEERPEGAPLMCRLVLETENGVISREIPDADVDRLGLKIGQEYSRKLAVILPGIGYHKDKPLLYYSSKLAQKLGYDVISIEYHDMPQKIKGDAAMMKKAAEIAFSQMEEQLKRVDFSEYDEVVFIGKSIGSVVEASYVAKHGIKARQIWYTPVEATFQFATSNVLAFIGDADPWSDVDKIKDMAKIAGISLYSYEDCNHSLESEDVLRNIEILQEVMKLTDTYLRGE